MYYSVKVSIAICIPSLNAYSNNASSERLEYSLQQSWNFSKIPSVRPSSFWAGHRCVCWCIPIVASSRVCCVCCPRAAWYFLATVLLSCFSYSAPPVSTQQYHRRERKSRLISKKILFLWALSLIPAKQILSLDTLRLVKQNTTDFSSVLFCRKGCLFGCYYFAANFARLRVPFLFWRSHPHIARLGEPNEGTCTDQTIHTPLRATATQTHAEFRFATFGLPAADRNSPLGGRGARS